MILAEWLVPLLKALKRHEGDQQTWSMELLCLVHSLWVCHIDKSSTSRYVSKVAGVWGCSNETWKYTIIGIKRIMELKKSTVFLRCIMTLGIDKCMSGTSIISGISGDFR